MKLDPVEKKLFLEAIHLKYGYDFRLYTEASMVRRLEAIMGKYGYHDVLDLMKRVLKETSFFEEILPFLTIGTTELFRDPEVFKSIRHKIIPFLKTYPSFNIWIAGCSTGEEVYSLAVLLREEDLLRRATIYATDINPVSLKTAQEGIYRIETIQTFVKNYTEAGGSKTPSEYYTAEYDLARFDPTLRERVVFSEHNLASDEVFREMHLILCRNVLIYFNRELQNRVFDLFYRSLVHRGFLVLGSKETTKFSDSGKKLPAWDEKAKIFQKNDLRNDKKNGTSEDAPGGLP